MYFLSRSILEESIGRSAKHDFRQFNMTKIELPGASEAGTTVEDLLDDKKYDWIAEKYNFYFCNFLTKFYENHYRNGAKAWFQ